MPPSSPQTPLKTASRPKSRVRSNTLSFSSPSCSSGKTHPGSSPAPSRSHHPGASIASQPITAQSFANPIRNKCGGVLSSARGHTSRSSIGTPFASASRQLNAPRGAPPVPPLVSNPLCTPPLAPPSTTATVFGYPFPNQFPSTTSVDSSRSPNSPRNLRSGPSPHRRRTSSSSSFRSALAAEFDNAVRKRDEESAHSSFSLQNRQLWADALFLRLCSRPSALRILGGGVAGGFGTDPPSAAPTAQLSTPAAVAPPQMPPPEVPASALSIERSSKGLYRKREGSSSLGRFKKPAGLGHRSTKTLPSCVVDVAITDSSAESSPISPSPTSSGSARLHRRRPSMPVVSSPSKEEPSDLPADSPSVPRLPEWVANERTVMKSEERPAASALSHSESKGEHGASSDVRITSGVACASDRTLAQGDADPIRFDHVRLALSPLDPTIGIPHNEAVSSAHDEHSALVCNETVSASMRSPARRNIEHRASLPERGMRRQRARTLGASYRLEHVTTKKGIGGRAGILPNLLPVLFASSASQTEVKRGSPATKTLIQQQRAASSNPALSDIEGCPASYQTGWHQSQSDKENEASPSFSTVQRPSPGDVQVAYVDEEASVVIKNADKLPRSSRSFGFVHPSQVRPLSEEDRLKNTPAPSSANPRPVAGPEREGSVTFCVQSGPAASMSILTPSESISSLEASGCPAEEEEDRGEGKGRGHEEAC